MCEIVKSEGTKISVIGNLAGKLQCDPKHLTDTLKKTAFGNCRNNEEFMAMCMVANQYGLNPLLKEIYAFPAKSGGVMPMVSVDGWIRLMQGNPAFDGIEFEEGEGYCTAVIWRKDRHHPTKITEYLSECYRKTEPWSKWPKRMLRNKALIQCARIAFGFAGIYDPDECERHDEAFVAEVKNVEEQKPKAFVESPTSTGKLKAVLAARKPAIEISTPVAEAKVEEPVTIPDPVPAEQVEVTEEELPY